MGRRRQAFGALFSFAASRHRTTVRLTGTLRAMGDGGASSTKFAARSCGELRRAPGHRLSTNPGVSREFGRGFRAGFRRAFGAARILAPTPLCV